MQHNNLFRGTRYSRRFRTRLAGVNSEPELRRYDAEAAQRQYDLERHEQVQRNALEIRALMEARRLERERIADEKSTTEAIGDRDLVLDGVWASVCHNPEDPITLQDWRDVDANEDVVSILPAEGGQGAGGYCIKRSDLVSSMEATKVYRWIPRRAEDPQYGAPDTRITYYKLPLGVRIDGPSFQLVKSGKPRTFLYALEYVGQDLMGTERSISSMHGSQEKFYRLVPRQSVQEFHTEERRKYKILYPVGKLRIPSTLHPPIPTFRHSPKNLPKGQVAQWCRLFALDQTVSPVTGRTIKRGGPTHQKFTKMCQGFQGFR